MTTPKRQTSGHQWLLTSIKAAAARCRRCGERAQMLVRRRRRGLECNCPSCGVWQAAALEQA